MSGAAPFRFQPANEGLTFGTSPQDAAARLSLQHMAGQIAINKQLQAENALKIQAQQEDQNDQGTIQQAFHDNIGPDGKVDFDKVRATVAPVVRFRNLQGLEKEHNDLLTGTLKMSQEQRAELLAKNTAIGNELIGTLQAPKDQYDNSWAGSRQRLIQQGIIDPNDPEFPEQAPDAQTIKSLAAKHGYAAAIQKLATDKAEEERKGAAEEKAKQQALREEGKRLADEKQAKVEDNVKSFMLAAPADQASYDTWLSSVDKDFAARLPKKFDPEKTPDLIENVMLSPKEIVAKQKDKVQAEHLAEQTMLSGGAVGLARMATDPTLGAPRNKAARAALDLYESSQKRVSGAAQAVQDRYDRTEMDKDRNRFQDVRQKEVEKWGDVQKIENALAGAWEGGKLDDSKKVDDPFSQGQISVGELKGRLTDARTRAQELNKDGKQILQQHGWGEFSGQQPATPAAPEKAPEQKLRTDIPKAIADGIAEGQSRPVKTPEGTVTLKKSGGKIYQVK